MDKNSSNTKSYVEVLVARIGLTGTILAALCGLVGVCLTGFFGYLNIQTQVRVPIEATQTAEAKSSLNIATPKPIVENPITPVLTTNTPPPEPFQTATPTLNPTYTPSMPPSPTEPPPTITVKEAPPIEITDGLVAYFPFDGSIDDISESHLVGKSYGGAFAVDRFGNDNGAYSFDGVGDHIRYGDTLNDVNIPFTISAWVWVEKPYWFFTSDDNINDSGNYAGFWFGVPLGKLDIGYGDGTGDHESNRRSKISNPEIPLRTWTHIAAVVQGKEDISLYIDGVEVDGQYGGGGRYDMIHNSWTIKLGGKTKWASLADGPAYFGGLVDDIYVYNRALTAQEIEVLYQ